MLASSLLARSRSSSTVLLSSFRGLRVSNINTTAVHSSSAESPDLVPSTVVNEPVDPTKFVPTSPFQQPQRQRRLIKHKIPRKRASLLELLVKQEGEAESKLSKPAVFAVDFSVGDAVEIEYKESMEKGARVDKIRGVVLGKVNKGLGSSIHVRDVVLETVIERQIPLHSPLCLSLKVIEKNFVKKGRRKIKRAKLYYLRDRPDNEVRVTG